MRIEDQEWTTEPDFTAFEEREVPKHQKDIEATTDDLLNAVKSVETKTTLEQITLSVLLSSVVYNSSMDAHRVAITGRMAEHLIGLILTHEQSSTDRGFKELLRKFGIMKSSHFLSRYSSKDSNSTTESEDRYRSLAEEGMLRRKLTTGGFVMTNLLFEAARRAYSPFEKELRQLNGFGIDEAIAFAQYIEIIDGKMKTRLINQSSFAPQELSSRVDVLEMDSPAAFFYKTQKFEKDCKIVKDFYNDVENQLYSIWYTKEMLLNQLPEEYEKTKFEQYLDRMSIEIDEAEKVSQPRHPSDFNPVQKHPLIQQSNHYLVPIPNLLRHSLIETFYYDLIDHPKIGGKRKKGGGEFGDRFGYYLEKWTYDTLTEAYGYGNVYLNPKYSKTGDEAADVLVEAKNTLLSIQCKTAKIPLSAQEDNFDTIEAAISEKAGKGYQQARNLISRVNKNEVLKLETDNRSIDLTSYVECIPIVVVGTPHNDLSTFYFDLIIDDSDRAPFVIDIYDLIMVVSCLPDVGQLIDYINRRREVIQEKSHYSADELDYLGIYLELGHFPTSDTHDMILLADHVDNVLSHLGVEGIDIEDYFS